MEKPVFLQSILFNYKITTKAYIDVGTYSIYITLSKGYLSKSQNNKGYLYNPYSFKFESIINNNNNNGKLQQASQLVLRGWETVEFHP